MKFEGRRKHLTTAQHPTTPATFKFHREGCAQTNLKDLGRGYFGLPTVACNVNLAAMQTCCFMVGRVRGKSLQQCKLYGLHGFSAHVGTHVPSSVLQQRWTLVILGRAHSLSKPWLKPLGLAVNGAWSSKSCTSKLCHGRLRLCCVCGDKKANHDLRTLSSWS